MEKAGQTREILMKSVFLEIEQTVAKLGSIKCRNCSKLVDETKVPNDPIFGKNLCCENCRSHYIKQFMPKFNKNLRILKF